jgi:hypothetical protein
MPMRLSGFAFVLAMPWLQIQVSRAQETPIDTARSTITIHAGKAGLLSSAGHDHWISAPISSGVIRDSGVEFKVETAKMLVKPDPKVDAKTRATIQKDWKR